MNLFERVAFGIRSAVSVGSPKASLTATEHYRDRDSGGFRQTVTGSKFAGATSWRSLGDWDYEQLRDKARVAHWESPQARSLIGRKVDNVIGAGLTLQAAPHWELIEPKIETTDTEAMARRQKWKRDVEIRFHLWANGHESDVTGQNSYYWQQKFALENKERDGEIFAVLRYDDDPARMSPLSIQFYAPEQIVQPTGASDIEAAKARGNTVKCGIECTPLGREVAIYVAEDPNFPTKYTRVPYFGPSGRRFVVHSFRKDMVGRLRGLPALGPYIHELQKMTDASVAELEAMVINSLLAWQTITDKDAAAGGNKTIASVMKAGAGSVQNGSKTAELKVPGIVIGNDPGTKVESFNTSRPNMNIQAFIEGTFKNIASAESVGLSVATMTHDASYSAARGAFLQFWTMVAILRDEEASTFGNLIYEAWFREEVAAKRIKAPGFGRSPVITAAWLNCSWLGAQMPALNPQDDAKADNLRIEAGLKTRERAAMEYNGSDYHENVSKLGPENEKLALANKSLVAQKSPQLALPMDDEEPEDTPKDEKEEKEA